MSITRKDFIKMSGVAAASALLGNGNAVAANISKEGLSYAPLPNEETKRPKVKITVLKRECYEDLQEKYLSNPKAGPCKYFYDGQEFILENNDFFRLLHGKFCAEAWDCISRYVYAALQGGSIMRGWTNDEKMMIACCNDGTRPVIFKIERIDS